MKKYYSNCLIEALKAKIKYKNQVKLIYIPPQYTDGFDFVPHWLWWDKLDNNVYDFHTDERLRHWWNIFWWKGYIRVKPKKIFDKWLNKIKYR